MVERLKRWKKNLQLGGWQPLAEHLLKKCVQRLSPSHRYLLGNFNMQASSDFFLGTSTGHWGQGSSVEFC